MTTNQSAGAAEWIFRETVEAMQQAEELGGPRGIAYIQLMEAIGRVALQRARTYALQVHRAAQSHAPTLTHETVRRHPGHDLERLRPVATEFGISIPEVQELYAYCEAKR